MAVPVGEVLARLMPERNERVEKLKEVAKEWGSVVGPARARKSAPFALEGGKLRVASDTPHAAQQLVRMKGNIQRALKRRWDLEVEELQVIVGQPPPQPSRVSGPPRRSCAPVRLDEEEVRAFRDACPAELDEETAMSLARLRAFFARRFPGEEKGRR